MSAATNWIEWLMTPQLGVIGNVLLAVAFSLITPAYPIYMHGRFGQTFGKFIAGVRVRDLNGGRLSYRQAAIRDFVPVLLAPVTMWYYVHYVVTGEVPHAGLYRSASSMALAWVVLEMLTMLLNDKRRAIHDFIANTVVVRIRQRVGARLC
jgi:uncharacterized RDD family membrane protein YckC